MGRQVNNADLIEDHGLGLHTIGEAGKQIVRQTANTTHWSYNLIQAHQHIIVGKTGFIAIVGRDGIVMKSCAIIRHPVAIEIIGCLPGYGGYRGIKGHTGSGKNSAVGICCIGVTAGTVGQAIIRKIYIKAEGTHNKGSAAANDKISTGCAVDIVSQGQFVFRVQFKLAHVCIIDHQFTTDTATALVHHKDIEWSKGSRGTGGTIVAGRGHDSAINAKRIGETAGATGRVQTLSGKADAQGVAGIKQGRTGQWVVVRGAHRFNGDETQIRRHVGGLAGDLRGNRRQ